MTLEQLLQKGTIQLEEANISEAKLDAMYLLEHVCQITRMDYLLDAKKPVSAEQEEEYDAFISKRAQHIPLQQLLGEQEFMGYSFFVNENVLIPRQDTEILVEEVAKLGSGKRILDVCTGSGCILLSLEKLCEPVVAAIFAGLLFGEVPTIPVFVGGAMILGGVLYYSKIEREV